MSRGVEVRTLIMMYVGYSVFWMKWLTRIFWHLISADRLFHNLSLDVFVEISLWTRPRLWLAFFDVCPLSDLTGSMHRIAVCGAKNRLGRPRYQASRGMGGRWHGMKTLHMPLQVCSAGVISESWVKKWRPSPRTVEWTANRFACNNCIWLTVFQVIFKNIFI